MSATQRYLLDTNIIIAAMRGHAEIRRQLEQTPLSRLVLSPVVLGELEFGAEKSRYAERNRARLDELMTQIPPQPLDASVAKTYGRLRAHLEAGGTPIGANDLWIAAHALDLDATMVTDNLREFSRVPGLRVEDWLAAQA